MFPVLDTNLWYIPWHNKTVWVWMVQSDTSWVMRLFFNFSLQSLWKPWSCSYELNIRPMTSYLTSKLLKSGTYVKDEVSFLLKIQIKIYRESCRLSCKHSWSLNFIPIKTIAIFHKQIIGFSLKYFHISPNWRFLFIKAL